MTSYDVTLVSHTHWDRAWYCTFQEYRIRLVKLVDKLIDIVNAEPEFRVYMLDGQMSVLEDYLEVRPQRAAELHELCKSGQIQVGPWYVLADEFLVSPESLIRNLMLGRRMGEPYGGVMSIGYVPDGFGHIAQLPQILRGFGIDNAFFWRGMGIEGDDLGTEFEWHAPDGSHVTTILMPWGYHNVSNLGYAIHWGDVSQMEFDWNLAQTKIEKAIDKLKPMANTDAILLMNGIDHAEPEPRIPEVIAKADAAIPDARVQHGTLADHLEHVRKAGKSLPKFEGEFRWGRYSEILQGVYSTRIHLKQENHSTENLLERYVEPLTAMAKLSGADVLDATPDLVRKAWNWLLLNHPHDDLYGCGIDEVHHEMAYRFSQAQQIGNLLVRDSLRHIAREVDYTGRDGIPIIVYNPLAWERSEIVEVEIEFVYDDPLADDFQLTDVEGNVVPYQLLADDERFWMEVLKANRKRCVRLLCPVNMPALGFTTLYVQPAGDTVPSPLDLQIYERGAENQFHSFVIENDGGITLTDKVSGHMYTDLHHFSDAEDIGDAYSYCPFPESHIISTQKRNAVVTLIESGPCCVTFQIERTLDIPVGLTDDRQQRSAETVSIPITSEVSLYANHPGLYITTVVDNKVRDHKLTVKFPTQLEVDAAHVDESFMIATRSLKLPDSTGWVEDPTPLMHQRSFTDLSDGDRGLAILNRGLPSVEVTETGEIALTLLRSIGWLSRDDLWVRRIAAGPLPATPAAQCIGAYRFEYAILPHSGNWQQIFQDAHNFNSPPLARRADTHPGLELHEMNITRDDPAQVTPIAWPRGGNWPDSLSLINIEPAQLVLSAVRQSENGMIVRFYNVTRQAIDGILTCGIPLAAANRLNLAEEFQESLTVSEENQLSLLVGGGEIITVELIPA